MEVFLREVVPRVTPGVTAHYRVLAGKINLLRNLSDRLRGYAPWIEDSGIGIVIVIDRDGDDCEELGRRIDKTVVEAGLRLDTLGRPETVLVRIAVEELESWLLGDVPALCSEFSRVPATLASKQKFRTVDDINGGTWETLEATLQKYGYFLGGLPKVECARRVAPHINVDNNRSHSFAVFRDGLKRLTGVA